MKITIEMLNAKVNEMESFVKGYNTRVAGDPVSNLLAMILTQCKADASDTRRSIEDRMDAVLGFMQWIDECGISTAMCGSDSYLNDRQHGIRI